MTTFTSARASRILPPQGHGWASQIVSVWGHINVAANPADGDIYEMCICPNRFLAIGGLITGADIDTGTEAMDLDAGWAANGGAETDKLVSPWGTEYNNAGYQADPDGFGNFGVWSGDGITDLFAAGQIYKPIILQQPLYFDKKTVFQIEANVAANAFTAGQIMMVVNGFIV